MEHANAVKARQFLCKSCGARLSYDPTSQTLNCANCHSSLPFETDQAVIREWDLDWGLAQTEKRGFGTESRRIHCSQCGAIFSTDPHVSSSTCHYCASHQVVELKDHRGVFRPESLLPLRLSREQADETFRGWLRKLWLRPNDLKRMAQVSSMHGVYVPYWTFDARVASTWSAMAGYHYYEMETQRYTKPDGSTDTRTVRVQKTRWMPASGKRDDMFDDLLICASRGLPEKLVKKLQSFRTSELVPYKPDYLSGWVAEEYQIELKEAWQKAIVDIEVIQYERCGNDVPGDTHMGLDVTCYFSDETFKHVLLPIWIAAYRYRNQAYRFLVNGQTGEISGEAPWSFWKIFFLILFIACAMGAFAQIAYMKYQMDSNY